MFLRIMLGLVDQLQKKIDELKSEQAELQKKVLNFQTEQLVSVQKTVKSELDNGLKSWSDVVTKNTEQVQSCVINTTKKSVKKVMEKVNEEERRSSNLMFFGVPEEESEDLGTVIPAIFKTMRINPPKAIDLDGYRIGKRQEGKVRPIRLECQIRSDVDLVHVMYPFRAVGVVS